MAEAILVFIVQTAAAMAISYAASSLFRPSSPRVKPTEVIRELSQPSSRPPYRYAYGRFRVYGTPAPFRSKGNILYGCLILNSRPSEGGSIKIYIDKRELESTAGDIFDFAGPGLKGQLPSPAEDFSEATKPRFWLGLGDQTSPPDDILSEASEYFQSSDGWQGRTVLWVALNAGETEARINRWPRVPPDIEVEMDWSKVWDPRDVAQDPDDPETWEFSNNHSLILLDALRQNPIREFKRDNLLLQSFIDAANECDVLVSKKDLSQEKRYTANGVIIWDGREIEEQLQPLVDSAAATLVRSGGRLGYLPGVWRAPDETITDLLQDSGIDYQRLVPGRDLPLGVVVAYVNPDRDWREAELPVYQVPGAAPFEGNAGTVNIKIPFCTSPTQAMRIQKIAAQKIGGQKKLQCTLPPQYFHLMAGCVVTFNLPTFTHLNGTWEMTRVNPGLSLAEPEGGVALRVPVTLEEIQESFFAWDPATEEVDLATEVFVPTTPPINPISNLQAASGSEHSLAGQPRIKFWFDPSDSGSVVQYEWQWRQVGEPYQQGGYIDAGVVDGAGKVFGYVVGVYDGFQYDIRVRASSIERFSTWTEIEGIVAIAVTPTATGGTVSDVTIDGVDYRIHQFTGSGTFTIDVDCLCDVLCVGGGGGGGAYYAGGGGGGFTNEDRITIPAGSHAVTVGGGGGGGIYTYSGSTGPAGNPGGASSVAALISASGGDGGDGGINGDGGDGGSGGGGGTNAGDGGDGGGNGSDGNDTGLSLGGIGQGTVTISNITGSYVYYSGGGGGGGNGAGIGGIGGGGNTTQFDGLPGTANTGGGGGGAGYGSGGSGGSGKVIIRYQI